MNRHPRASTDISLQKLEALREVSLVLTSERDLNRLLELIMEKATEILRADRSTLYLVEEGQPSADGKGRRLFSRVIQGAQQIRLPLNEKSIAGFVALTGRVINLEDAYSDPRFNPSFDERFRYRTRSVLAVPMRNPKGEIIGVMQALNKKEAPRFDREDEEIFLAFSTYAAIAVENARYLQLQKRTFETLIQGQAVAIDARDHITAGHTWRVAAYAVEIGKALGWEGERLEILRYAGLLHDQGKLGVPDEILLKAGKLTSDEYRLIQSHAEKTKRILDAVRPLFPRNLRKVPEIAAAHHEKLDGSGYPEGLKGEEISMEARILAVADVFDALTARRPYREPAGDEEALRYLQEDALAGKLDPRMVEALTDALPQIVQCRERVQEQIRGRWTWAPPGMEMESVVSPMDHG